MRPQTTLIIILISSFCLFGPANLVIVNFSQAASEETTLSLVPATSAVNQGEEILIYVNIANIVNLYSLQISLQYDSALLKYEDVSEGTFLNENGQATTFRINPVLETGSVKGYAISRVGSVPGISGNGQLAIFRFRGLSVGTANITILQAEKQGTKLLNADLETLTYKPANAAITIREPEITSIVADTLPPFIKSASPAKNALDVPKNSAIMIEITDTNTGVDPFSIVLTVNKTRVSAALSAQDSKGQIVSYQPANAFDYNQIVEITVDARDRATPANVMPQERYSFIIEPKPDTTPPIISQINVVDVTTHSATITWRTDESATSKVNYKTGSSNVFLEVNQDQLTRQHLIILDNLQADTSYTFQVSGRDYQENLAIASEQSFTTKVEYILEGTLVKGIGANVYLVENSKKRLIPSAQIFESRGWQWSEIITLTENALNSYLLGENISPGLHNKIVKGQAAQIYLIKKNEKRPILSAYAFESQGFKWSEIITISDESLNTFGLGPNISVIFKQDKALVKLENDPRVWLIEKNTIRHILSADIFNSYKFSWQDIQTITIEEKSEYPPNHLIKTAADPHIYHLTDHLRRKGLITSAVAFERYGWDWNQVVTVNQTEFNAYTSGSDIY